MNIRCKDDLCLAYKLLSIFNEIGKRNCQKAIDIKRQIRSYLHRSHNTKIIRDDGIDGYVSLSQLPEFLDNTSKDEAVEWFKYNCYIEPTYSAYDCTGKPFTSWFKVFRRQEHWFVFHCVGFDV